MFIFGKFFDNCHRIRSKGGYAACETGYCCGVFLFALVCLAADNYIGGGHCELIGDYLFCTVLYSLANSGKCLSAAFVVNGCYLNIFVLGRNPEIEGDCISFCESSLSSGGALLKRSRAAAEIIKSYLGVVGGEGGDYDNVLTEGHKFCGHELIHKHKGVARFFAAYVFIIEDCTCGQTNDLHVRRHIIIVKDISSVYRVVH